MPATPTPGFRRVSEVKVFGFWVFSIGRAELLDPNGDPFERFIIHHPGAVTIIAVLLDLWEMTGRPFRIQLP